MAIAVDQATLGQFESDTALTTIPFTTSAAVAVGGFIVITVTWFSGTQTLSSVSGGGLTWTIDKTVRGGSSISSNIAKVSAQAPQGLASGTTITATLSGAAGGGCAICGTSYTGVATASPVDVVSAANDTATTAWATPSMTIAAGSVIEAAAVNDHTFGTSTPTSPSVETHDFGASPTGFAITSAHRIETSAGSFTVAGTWTASTTGAGTAVGVAYKANPVDSYYVQSTGVTADASAVNIAASLTGVAAGNLLVCVVSHGNKTDTVSVSDNNGNTWTLIEQSEDTTDNQSLGIWYAKNVNAGAVTVTATWGGISRPFRRIVVGEYTGLDTSAPLDVHTKNFATSASPTTGSVTTTVANDLTVTGLNFNAAVLADGAGLWHRQSVGGIDFLDRKEGAAGSVSGTWTGASSVLYQAVIATFKPASAGQTLSVGHISSSAAVRGVTLALTKGYLNVGHIATSAAVRGVALSATGHATMLVGHIASAAAVRGVTLKTTLQLFVGHISSPAAVRGVTLRGTGHTTMLVGHISSVAAVRGALLRLVRAMAPAGFTTGTMTTPAPCDGDTMVAAAHSSAGMAVVPTTTLTPGAPLVPQEGGMLPSTPSTGTMGPA